MTHGGSPSSGDAASRREPILAALTAVLEPLPYVHAFYEGGALAWGRIDVWTDLDLYAVVDGGIRRSPHRAETAAPGDPRSGRPRSTRRCPAACDAPALGSAGVDDSTGLRGQDRDVLGRRGAPPDPRCDEPSAERIRATVGPIAQRCWTSVSGTQREGRMVVELRLGPASAIRDVCVAEDDIGSAPLRTCILHALWPAGRPLPDRFCGAARIPLRFAEPSRTQRALCE